MNDLRLTQISAVLFDLYGTLVDIKVDELSLNFWTSIRNTLDVAIAPEDLRDQYEKKCTVAIAASQSGQVIEEVFADWSAELSQTYRKPIDTLTFIRKFRQASRTSLQLRTYAKPLIHILQASGTNTAIVSNTEAAFTKVDLLDINMPPVDAMVLSSDVGCRKPHLKIFSAALNQLNLSPDKCVFIGDNWEEDIMGARHAGTHAIFLSDTPKVMSDVITISAKPSLKSMMAALTTLDNNLS